MFLRLTQKLKNLVKSADRNFHHQKYPGAPMQLATSLQESTAQQISQSIYEQSSVIDVKSRLWFQKKSKKGQNVHEN